MWQIEIIMTYQERQKLLDIKWKSKTAKQITEEELNFCIDMWEKFPQEFREVEDEMLAKLKRAKWYELI